MTGGRRLVWMMAALVLVAAACSSSSADQTAPTTTLPTTVPTTAATTTTTAPMIPLLRTLSDGVVGDDVSRLQQRLIDMGFDPGPVDGQYGGATTQAVWAFQKLVMGLAVPNVSNSVTPTLWDAMTQPLTVTPRRPQPAGGSHFEVYLPEQVAIVFHDNQPRLISHVSTGSNQKWCEAGFCSTSITPSGVYQLGRRVDGWDTGILGQMYNPIYFNYGVAVHGAYNVPLYPASHGCVRVPMHISKYFPSLVKRGDEVYVFDGKKEPEAYGSPPPPYNSVDPKTTTTLPPPTTVPKSTTSAANTTAKPATTTTATTPAPPPTTAAPATTQPATTAPPETTVATTAAVSASSSVPG